MELIFRSVSIIVMNNIMIINRYRPEYILNLNPEHTIRFVKGLGMLIEVAGLVNFMFRTDERPYTDVSVVDFDTVFGHVESQGLYDEVNQMILETLYRLDLIGDDLVLDEAQARELQKLRDEGHEPFVRMYARGYSNLMMAIKDGDLELVSRMLYVKADPNYTTYTGITPLMYASMHGHERIIQVLLEAGTDTESNMDLIPAPTDTLSLQLSGMTV